MRERYSQVFTYTRPHTSSDQVTRDQADCCSVDDDGDEWLLDTISSSNNMHVVTVGDVLVYIYYLHYLCL